MADASSSNGDLYELQQRLIATYHRKRSRGQTEAARAMLEKSTHELLADGKLVQAVTLIKLLFQGIREDGDQVDEQTASSMDKMWESFGAKIKNETEAALLVGTVTEFCSLVHQLADSRRAESIVLLEHRKLATILSEALPQRIGIYLPFAVSGLTPATRFIPVIEKTFSSITIAQSSVDEQQLASARVLLAYAAELAPSATSLAELRSSAEEFMMAMQGRPIPLLDFVGMFIKALEERKAEQAKLLMQFYGKFLAYDEQLTKSAQKCLDGWRC